jgi:hypothetical protein
MNIQVTHHDRMPGKSRLLSRLRDRRISLRKPHIYASDMYLKSIVSTEPSLV